MILNGNSLLAQIRHRLPASEECLCGLSFGGCYLVKDDMSNDGTLLREYAEAKSESAFAEIVSRYLDLVYSTALRGVGGDRHLAKDVTQGVFIDLAQKAGTLSNRSLTGWLYKSACFAAAKAVRSERRRHTREQEAHVMQERLNSAPPELDWEQINPLLNTVMLELGESDREVLLLRFFERRSLAEVGSQLGLTENTARMRVERALERLRGRLTRRGVTSTAAGLALALAHQAVSAAPLGLAASITAASLASGVTVSGSSILTLITMTHAKAVFVGAVIAAGAVTPAVLQHRANTRLQAELDVTRAQLLERAPSPTVSADPDERARTRSEHDELIRLRGELALLRQRVASTPKGPADASEFDRLKAAKLDRLAQEAVDAQRLLAKAPQIPMLPANSWTNQGVATPLAVTLRIIWRRSLHGIWRNLRAWVSRQSSPKKPDSSPSNAIGCCSPTWSKIERYAWWRPRRRFHFELRNGGWPCIRSSVWQRLSERSARIEETKGPFRLNSRRPLRA